MNKTWYNAERVSQSGSVILNEWRASREAERRSPVAAGKTVPISEATSGTEMYELLTGGMSGGAGIPVSEHTAMAVGAVYACVALIGGALAALPFHLYKRIPDGRERYDHKIWWLFNESPWPNWTAASARQFAAQSIGLKGDAFWRIHRSNKYSLNADSIIGFEPYHPDRVSVHQYSDGSLYYPVQTLAGNIEVVEAEDMLHFPGVGFDGRRSMTPLRAALRPAAGIALAADEYAGAFFRNGARPDFALRTPGKLDEGQADLLRKTWFSKHQGPGLAHLPAILTGGLEVQELTMNAEDAQLLATRNFQVADIARIFGVPGHMIGFTEKTTSFGAGVENMSISFVRYTLRRYLDAMQQEINRKIWPRSLTVYGEFNADALMDGDSKAQADYFGKSLGGPGNQGWMTINEVRRLKNLPPVEGGDRVFIAGTTPAAPGTSPDPAGTGGPKDPAGDPPSDPATDPTED